MASPMYDNKWLASRQPGKDYTVDILKSANAGDFRPPTSDPVAEAKAFLQHSDELHAPQNQYAQDKAQQETDAQYPAMHGGLRGFTEMLSHAGGVAGAASLPAMLAGPAASLPLMVGGAAMQIPDQLRRAYAPQSDETPPGLMEAGGTALALSPMLSHLGEAGAVADEVGPAAARLRKTFGVRQASEVPYQMESTARKSAIPSAWEKFAGSPTNLSRSSAYEGRSLEGGAQVAPQSNIDRTRTFGDLNERVQRGGVQFDPANLDRTRTYGNAREAMTNGGVQVVRPSLAALLPPGQASVEGLPTAAAELSSPGSQEYMARQFARQDIPLTRSSRDIPYNHYGPEVDLASLSRQVRRSRFGLPVTKE